MDKLEIFADAAKNYIGSDYAYCQCGKVHFSQEYVDSSSEVDEELHQKLLDEGKAINNGGGDYIEFEGKQYVRQCDCWQDRAKIIIGFLNGHRDIIADYFNETKKQAIKIANDLATIDQ